MYTERQGARVSVSESVCECALATLSEELTHLQRHYLICLYCFLPGGECDHSSPTVREEAEGPRGGGCGRAHSWPAGQ